MGYRDTKQALGALTAIAAAQGGYFTARQAWGAGYDYPHLSYHIDRGNFERVDRGLYRLPTIPPSEHDDLIRLSLWSRRRDDRPQAVVSHQSALGLHDLSDVLPGKVHMTVPRSFRKAPPSNCVLHKGVLEPSDWDVWAGFRVTTPLKTLIDVAADVSVPTEQLRLAVCDALERGLVMRRKLLAAVDEAGAGSRLHEAVEAAG